MKSHINLMAREVLYDEKPFPIKPMMIPLTVAAALAVLTLFSAWNFYRASVLKKEVRDLGLQRDNLRQEAARINSEIGQLTDAAPVPSETAESRASVMENILSNRIAWSEVVREISLVVPEGVWLTRMESLDSKPGGILSSEAKKTIRFAGFARSQDAIHRFMSALERSPYYGTVSLVYSQKGGGTGEPPVNFELTANLRSL